MGYRHKYSGINLLLGFLSGGLLGAGLILLFTPNSGEETRRKIREMTDDVTGEMAKYVGDVKEKAISSIGVDKDIL
jgi:gas vesicle protein